MSTYAPLSANSFRNDRPNWDGLVPSTQTWTVFKLIFVPLHSAMDRELRASSQLGDSFGSANLTLAAHGITVVSHTHPTTGRVTASPDDIMAQFDGHFDNLSAAATNSGAALDQLAATTTTQYGEIKSLLTALKTASGLSSYDAATTTDSTTSIPPAEAKRRIS